MNLPKLGIFPKFIITLIVLIVLLAACGGAPTDPANASTPNQSGISYTSQPLLDSEGYIIAYFYVVTVGSKTCYTTVGVGLSNHNSTSTSNSC